MAYVNVMTIVAIRAYVNVMTIMITMAYVNVMTTMVYVNAMAIMRWHITEKVKSGNDPINVAYSVLSTLPEHKPK